MEGVNSSDNLLVSDGPGDDNDQDQEVLVNPHNRTQSSAEGYMTENGVTVISFDKSKHVVNDKCSLSLIMSLYLSDVEDADVYIKYLAIIFELYSSCVRREVQDSYFILYLCVIYFLRQK